MHVDGDEIKIPEKTAPFKYKVRDHANRTSFKTSPTWSNCRQTAKVANAYITTFAELFPEIFFFLRN